ncbi:MAG: hypothetical protein L0Z50_18400 [Verrucomicrobiales bacterium]|nr:hypothetical protein [Verrucomicrobiales bacterium]
MIVQNFLDLDTAYLLGLLVMRGQLIETGGDHRIVISFPSKNLIASGVKLKFEQKKHLRLAANQVRDRLSEFLGTDIQVKELGKDVQFLVRFLGNNMIWRNLCFQVGTARSYTNFGVPESIFSAPAELKTEFLRGVADAGGFIRDANNYMGLKRRVYLEVNNKNWHLPIQLCRLLQQDLQVPVHIIQWGHPNTRAPHVHTGKSWAKEHQIKIFAEQFIKIGFYIDYKQRILEEFVEADSKIKQKLPPFCNPNPRIREPKRKPKHPDEKSNYLPSELRGKHFGSYWQICLAMGCQQCVDARQKELFEIDELADTR